MARANGKLTRSRSATRKVVKTMKPTRGLRINMILGRAEKTARKKSPLQSSTSESSSGSSPRQSGVQLNLHTSQSFGDRTAFFCTLRLFQESLFIDLRHFGLGLKL